LAILALATGAQAGPIVSGSNQVVVEETFANGTDGETGLDGAWNLDGDGSWTSTGLIYQGIGTGGAFTGSDDRTPLAENSFNTAAIATMQETATGREIWISCMFSDDGTNSDDNLGGSITIFAQDTGPDSVQNSTMLLVDGLSNNGSMGIRERATIGGDRTDYSLVSGIGSTNAVGEANLVLLKLVLSSDVADTVQLWVNPDVSGGLVDLNSGASSGVTSLTHDFQYLTGIQIRPQNAGPGGSRPDIPLRWDEIRFEVVPEPATMSLLGLGGLVALRRRRRA
jgi:hypothetical protein